MDKAQLKIDVDGAKAGTIVEVISDADENGVWTSDPEFATLVEIRFDNGDTMMVNANDLNGIKTYNAKFTGRLLGAIGITYPITTTVEGYDELSARRALYERYDCVHNLVLTVADTN